MIKCTHCQKDITGKIKFCNSCVEECADKTPLEKAAPDLLVACKALMETPTPLPPDNQFDIEQRKYRNACMNKIAAARKLGKAALAKTKSQ